MARSRAACSVGTSRVLAVAVVLVFGGCAAPAARRPVEADPLGGLPDPFLFGEGHDHRDAGAHAFAAQVEVLGHDDLWTQSGVPVSGPILADFAGPRHIVVSDLLAGFVVVDVTDPARPRAVGRGADPAFANMDIQGSDDGRFAFLAVGSTGLPSAGATGIQVWSLADPARPLPVGYWPMVEGCHTLTRHEDLLFCAGPGAVVHILRIVPLGAAVALQPVGTWSVGLAPPPVLDIAPPLGLGGTAFAHEVTVADDALLARPLMYVALWDGGIRIVDVSDPARPVDLGGWDGEGRDDSYDGKMHSIAVSSVEGRRVLAVVPEFSATPAVTFLDATDVQRVTVLGVWIPKPLGAYDNPLWYSTHNLQFHDGRLYVAMYHAGVWLLDAGSLEALRQPRAVGYALPAWPVDGRALPPVVADYNPGAPMTLDVLVRDSVFHVADFYSGIVALRPTGPAIGS